MAEEAVWGLPSCSTMQHVTPNVTGTSVQKLFHVAVAWLFGSGELLDYSMGPCGLVSVSGISNGCFESIYPVNQFHMAADASGLRVQPLDSLSARLMGTC